MAVMSVAAFLALDPAARHAVLSERLRAALQRLDPDRAAEDIARHVQTLIELNGGASAPGAGAADLFALADSPRLLRERIIQLATSTLRAGSAGSTGTAGATTAASVAATAASATTVTTAAPAGGAGAATPSVAASVAAAVRVPEANEDGFVMGMTLDFPAPSVTADHAQRALRLLDLSLGCLPESRDTDRPRPYLPRSPALAHPSFPTVPPPGLETPALFERLDADALFFAFYYQQGTYAQYLAAKELRKQSWRFHKKFSTWFQRHEEPKQTTQEFEEGTYIYFDYESGWCQRIKRDFRFDYAYLEDELV